MNSAKFDDAMGRISDSYIEEAISYEKKSRRVMWIRMGTVAACLAIVVAAAVFSTLHGRGGTTPPDISNPISLYVPESASPTAAPSDDPEVEVSMSSIVVNEIDMLVDAGRKPYDPKLYDEVNWDKDEVTDYYGKDLTPAYIPEELSPASANGKARVVVGKDGTVVEDTLWLNFYHDYYPDGSPKLTDGVAACKGFYLQASKIGIVDDCCFVLGEEEIRRSDIGGTSVTFGYRSMPYGPYDPVTHAPSGYYDLYVAEFELDGIEYKLVADQMELEELVKVVASVIYGEEAAVVK